MKEEEEEGLRGGDQKYYQPIVDFLQVLNELCKYRWWSRPLYVLAEVWHVLYITRRKIIEKTMKCILAHIKYTLYYYTHAMCILCVDVYEYNNHNIPAENVRKQYTK